MNFQTACKLLEKANFKVSVSMRKDCPVELLFWDECINNWNHFCNINEDETIPKKDEEDVWDFVNMMDI